MSEKAMNNRVSIRFKLLIFFIVISVIPIIVILPIIISKVTSTIETQSKSKLKIIVQKTIETINSNNDTLEKTANNIFINKSVNDVVAKNVNNYDFFWTMEKERKESIYNLLDAVQFSNKDINSIGMIKDDEIILSSYYRPEFKTYLEQIRNSKSFDAVKNTENAIWLNGFEENTIFYLKYNKITKYVLVFEVANDYLQKAVNGKLISENSVINILGEDKSDMITQTDTKINVNLTENIIQELNELNKQKELKEDEKNADEESNIILESDKQKITLYSKLDNGWYYIVETPLKDFLNDVETINIFVIIIGIISCLLSIIIAIFLSLNVEKPLKYIMNKMKKIEQGDLTVRTNIIGNKDMGKLSNSFNYMVENMNQLIRNISEITEDAAITSREVIENIDISSKTTNEVIKAIESVSIGATEQATNAESTSVIIKRFVRLVTEAERKFGEVLKLTNKALKASEKGNKVMSELNDSTEDTLSISKKIKEDTENLDRSLEKILSIIDIIGNLSEQTNLLSLNAAIEVARAGEAGKAFGVIATEIRQLAEQSNDAAKKVITIIQDTNVVTNQTKENVDLSINIFDKQVNSIKNIDEYFNQIVKEMNSINTKVAEVNNQLLDVNVLKEEALSSITNIVAISQESAAAIEEVLATGEEQTRTSEKLFEIVDNLIKKISFMESKIKVFKIN